MILRPIAVALCLLSWSADAARPAPPAAIGVAPVLAQAGPRLRAAILAHPRLLLEASLYFNSCRLRGNKHQNDICYSQHLEFIVNYVDAFYNFHTAQTNVAFTLSGQLAAPMLYWFHTSRLQACAWRLAIVGSGGPLVTSLDLAESRATCRPLPPSVRLAAIGRAKRIDTQINAHLGDGSAPINAADAYP